jgi:hypothetical protein
MAPQFPGRRRPTAAAARPAGLPGVRPGGLTARQPLSRAADRCRACPRRCRTRPVQEHFDDITAAVKAECAVCGHWMLFDSLKFRTGRKESCFSRRMRKNNVILTNDQAPGFLSAPGSGLGRPRPARPRRPVPGSTADLTDSFDLAGRAQWQPSSSRAVSSRGGVSRSLRDRPPPTLHLPSAQQGPGFMGKTGTGRESTRSDLMQLPAAREGKMPVSGPRVMAARRVETPSLR